MTKEESIELKDKFIELRAIQGKSFESIANELGVQKKTLLEWNRELKDKIEPLLDFRMEQMAEKFQFGETQKVECMGIIHKKLLDELNKRDLAEIPTPKILDMVLSIQEKLPKISEIRTGQEVMAMEWESTRPEKISIV